MKIRIEGNILSDIKGTGIKITLNPNTTPDIEIRGNTYSGTGEKDDIVICGVKFPVKEEQ